MERERERGKLTSSQSEKKTRHPPLPPKRERSAFGEEGQPPGRVGLYLTLEEAEALARWRKKTSPTTDTATGAIVARTVADAGATAEILGLLCLK